MTNKKIIIDVRTPEEFEDGNVSGSINIPLHEIQGRLEELKQIQGPIILCCASGGRSGQATSFLKQHGLDCENGGSWMQVSQ